jgi:hypothetical protein
MNLSDHRVTLSALGPERSGRESGGGGSYALKMPRRNRQLAW